MLKVTTYVFCFCNNLRKKTHRDRQGDKVSVDPPDAEEVEKAEEFWIKKSQVGLSTRIAKGDLKTLNSFVDGKGITRVGGRVDPALVSYDSKHAALLPYDHWISMLITHDVHQSGHPGIATITAKKRRKYWIVKGNKISKIIKRQYSFCKRMEANAETQLMAKLPTCRLQPFTTPFMFTSCDYFGPIKVKISRNKTAKHYGVLFTCLNTRAVHCELATDARTMEFLQVLRRLFSYRGYPKVMLSDNGSQNGGSRKRIASYDRRMGQNEAKRVLRRQWYDMAIHYAPCPTSEWML